MIRTHYDVLPPALLTGSVLDIGSRDGSTQRTSTTWPLIERAITDNRYMTLDLDPYPFVSRVGDMFSLCPEMIDQHILFDTVIANHVLEHIVLEQWPTALSLWKALLAPDGTLCIGTPYQEVPPMYRVTGPAHRKHHVYFISPDQLVHYLDDTCLFRIYKGPYSLSLMCFWQNRHSAYDAVVKNV